MDRPDGVVIPSELSINQPFLLRVRVLIDHLCSNHCDIFGLEADLASPGQLRRDAIP